MKNRLEKVLIIFALTLFFITNSSCVHAAGLILNKNVVFGEQSENVKKLQGYLISEQLLDSSNLQFPVSGKYDQNTVNAVKKLFKRLGIVANGKSVGPKTRAILARVASKETTPTGKEFQVPLLCKDGKYDFQDTNVLTVTNGDVLAVRIPKCVTSYSFAFPSAPGTANSSNTSSSTIKMIGNKNFTDIAEFFSGKEEKTIKFIVEKGALGYYKFGLGFISLDKTSAPIIQKGIWVEPKDTVSEITKYPEWPTITFNEVEPGAGYLDFSLSLFAKYKSGETRQIPRSQLTVTMDNPTVVEIVSTPKEQDDHTRIHAKTKGKATIIFSYKGVTTSVIVEVL